MEREKTPRAAIYCRLSEEDRDKQGEESESIQNQKAMLQQYACEQGWKIWKVYSDEDYTGADRSRPAFNQLLKDARSGCFDIVLCKSQSRFTRELELVERYLHGLFVQWGIRFVGYADHADTANHGNKKARQINGLVNEWYLEDLSDNIRTVFRTKQRQGQFIGSFAPYGYEKSPEDKNRLIPEPQAAAVVRQIFQNSAEGLTPSAVAHLLNDRGIPNPSTYKAARYAHFRRAGRPGQQWSGSTVRAILANPVYCGMLRQHLREKVSYKSESVRRVPAEEQITVRGTHTPLVDEALWQKAQPKSGGKPKRQPQTSNALQRLSRCAVCGCMLHVRYAHQKRYFACRSHRVLVQEAQLAAFAQQVGLEKLGRQDETVEAAEPIEAEGKVQQLQKLCAEMAAGRLSPEEFTVRQRKWQKCWQRRQASTKQSLNAESCIWVYPRSGREKIPRMEKRTAERPE